MHMLRPVTVPFQSGKLRYEYSILTGNRLHEIDGWMGRLGFTD